MFHDSFEFNDDDDDDDGDVMPFEPPSSERIQDANEKAQTLEGEAEKIGLHLLGMELGAASDGEGGSRMVIGMTFTPGKLAWSDKIQNPDDYEVKSEFKQIQNSLEEDEFEDYRKKLLGGGSGAGTAD